MLYQPALPTSLVEHHALPNNWVEHPCSTKLGRANIWQAVSRQIAEVNNDPRQKGEAQPNGYEYMSSVIGCFCTFERSLFFTNAKAREVPKTTLALVWTTGHNYGQLHIIRIGLIDCLIDETVLLHDKSTEGRRHWNSTWLDPHAPARDLTWQPFSKRKSSLTCMYNFTRMT